MLYHYSSYDALIKIIQSRTIWASNIHYLNDGSEYAYAFKVARAVLQTYRRRRSVERALYAAIAKELRDQRRTNIFVTSFSTNGDLLSQWRAYCPPSRGVSIGIDNAQLLKLCKEQGFELTRCVYDYDEQRALVREVLERVVEQYSPSEKDMEYSGRGFLAAFAAIAPQLKDPAFSEEQEWRLISPKFMTSDPDIKFRQGSSFIVPYVEFRLAYEDDASLSLQELFVGPTPHPELAAEALWTLLMSARVDWKEIKLSKVPFRSW